MSKTDAALPTVMSWQQGLQAILESTPAPVATTHTLHEALFHICAGAATSAIDVPPFDNSSMDGFAVRAEDITTSPVALRVIGEAPAGRPFTGTVNRGEAVEIMTGAPMPAGADTVVRVEDTSRPLADQVEIRVAAKLGTAVRRAGADTAGGDAVLLPGEEITPGRIALAASCGIDQLQVYRRPTIALAVGGDEIVPVESGRALQPGEIYESNSPMLLALLRSWNFEPVFLGRMPDDPAAMLDFLRRGLQYDVLLTVGGVSMGEHDYVRRCLTELGVHEVFWKLNQQPGGPLVYATAGNTQVFGLPGNPVSSYVCADIYVQAALRRRSGRAGTWPVRIHATLTEPLKKPHGKVAFVRCALELRDGAISARSTGPQDSNRIRSIAAHDGYILFPEDARELAGGDYVEVLLTASDRILQCLASSGS
jgi:molybdopterin molybdotransferase